MLSASALAVSCERPTLSPKLSGEVCFTSPCAYKLFPSSVRYTDVLGARCG